MIFSVFLILRGNFAFHLFFSWYFIECHSVLFFFFFLVNKNLRIFLRISGRYRFFLFSLQCLKWHSFIWDRGLAFLFVLKVSFTYLVILEYPLSHSGWDFQAGRLQLRMCWQEFSYLGLPKPITSNKHGDSSLWQISHHSICSKAVCSNSLEITYFGSVCYFL